MRQQIAEDERVIAEYIVRIKNMYPERYGAVEEEMRKSDFPLCPPEEDSGRS
jgi:hypothetical protein